LASRPVTGPSRLARPSTSPHHITQRHSFRAAKDEQLLRYAPSQTFSSNQIISSVPISVPATSQQFYGETLIPSTPQKPQFMFGLSTPQHHAFDFDPYIAQRTPFHKRPKTPLPSTPRHLESGHFTAVTSRAIREASATSPYLRPQMVTSVVSSRGRGVSPVRGGGRAGSGAAFVAGLTSHGGRR